MLALPTHLHLTSLTPSNKVLKGLGEEYLAEERKAAQLSDDEGVKENQASSADEDSSDADSGADGGVRIGDLYDDECGDHLGLLSSFPSAPCVQQATACSVGVFPDVPNTNLVCVDHWPQGRAFPAALSLPDLFSYTGDK